MRFLTRLFSLLLITFSFFLLTACDKPDQTKISIMTFNIENGGTQVDFNKVVDAIKASKADVVGIQEGWGNTKRIAQALGWKYYNRQLHIISRFPLLNPADGKNLYTYIEVQPGKVIAMANMHLPDEPYGPDMVKNGATATAVEQTEKKVRLPTAAPFIEKIATVAKLGIPVFLTGDFNSPSHLDWTTNTVNVLPNHRYVVVWPVTKMIQDKGLIDSYRDVHPDTIKDTAYTWPSGRPAIKNPIDGFNPSEKDLRDRVDFIYTAGNSKVIESHIVGEPGYQNVDISVSPWPSDHRAVVSRFEVIPVTISIDKIMRGAVTLPQGKPSITVSDTVIRTGEDFTITWKNLPGNGYDYIRITPVNSKKLAWGEAVRLYTHGEVNGSIQYNETNVKGNWLAWYKGEEGHWPMKPGIYNVTLMLDDGFKELATTQITVQP